MRLWFVRPPLAPFRISALTTIAQRLLGATAAIREFRNPHHYEVVRDGEVHFSAATLEQLHAELLKAAAAKPARKE